MRLMAKLIQDGLLESRFFFGTPGTAGAVASVVTAAEVATAAPSPSELRAATLRK